MKERLKVVLLSSEERDLLLQLLTEVDRHTAAQEGKLPIVDLAIESLRRARDLPEGLR